MFICRISDSRRVFFTFARASLIFLVSPRSRRCRPRRRRCGTAPKTLWDSDADLRKRFDFEKLVATMPATLAAELGEDKARQDMAYLRAGWTNTGGTRRRTDGRY